MAESLGILPDQVVDTPREEDCIEFEKGYDEAAREVLVNKIRWEDLERVLARGGCLPVRGGELCFDVYLFCWWWRKPPSEPERRLY